MWLTSIVSQAHAFSRAARPADRARRQARSRQARHLTIEQLEGRALLSTSGWLANSFPTDGYARGLGVALDETGNVYVTGYLQNTVNFAPTTSGSGISATSNSGTDDVFVAKLDPAGRFVWLRTIGGVGNDHASQIAVSANGDVYATGSFRGMVDFGSTQLTSVGGDDIFVTKLDTNGNFQWALRGRSRDYAPALLRR